MEPKYPSPGFVDWYLETVVRHGGGPHWNSSTLAKDEHNVRVSLEVVDVVLHLVQGHYLV